jgi:putative restriction endonuclease
MTEDVSLDQEMRLAAFRIVKRRLEIREQLTSEDLALGFDFRGERVPLINPRRGIFKPKSMKYLLSIKTVVPRSGARIWYDDQREAHQQIYEGDEVVDYAFMGQDAQTADNRWLQEAMVNRVPVIYFLGTAPGLYQPIIPTFIADWDARKLKAKLSFGLPGETRADPSESIAERRYALREVKSRLHQATFRSAVITAYGGRCALSGLPESSLLDAAHIAADSDERFGQPIVNNGLPLSKLHHAAFDSHLIGISPDYRIAVSDRLMSVRDGPTLEALKSLNGGRLILPHRLEDFPDRERLAIRFDAFRGASQAVMKDRQ